MEKFTVDLDAVLDEFEFHEGQANQVKDNLCPTVSGFFTPESELGPSSLDQINIQTGNSSTIIPGNHSPPLHMLNNSDIRYDIPLDSGTSSYSSDISKIQALPNHCELKADNEATSSNDQEDSDRYLEKNDSSALKVIAPDTTTNAYLDSQQALHREDPCEPCQINEYEEDELLPHTVIDEPSDLIEEKDSSQIRSRTSEKSLADELLELEFDKPGDDLKPVSLTPPMTGQKSVSQHEEDYVDERQIEEYLKQIEMEKCEEKLIEDNLLDSSCSSPQEEEEEDDSARTGTRPKQRLATSLEVNLSPSISSGQHVVIPTEFTISEADLTPVIGKSLPDCPPPYSEVDPMKDEHVSSVEGDAPSIDDENLRPTRPDSLNLGANSTTSQDLDAEDTSDDASVSEGDPVLGAPGETPANPTGPRLGGQNILDGLTEEQLLLGKIQPFWVPDADSPNCMICAAKFTVVKRRHHCRACGKVLCNNCCGERYRLDYMEGKEGRVCTPCKTILERLDRVEREGASAPAATRPNPSNPMEYCSRVPVSEQVSATGSSAVPSVMVPVGVLKRNGSTSEPSSLPRPENKSVMFSDGIRPGGDLTELDGGSEHRPLGKRPGRVKPRRAKGKPAQTGPASGDVCTSRMPISGLPFVSGKGKVDDEEIAVWFSAGTSVNFVLNNNLTVLTRRVKYSPINKFVWNFASRGLTSVGQDEVVILLEAGEEEALPPRDIFIIIQSIYEQAGAGEPVLEMGHITVNSEHLGSNSHGGWLFIRHTFQAVTDLFLPPPPVLFGILVMRWEIPWARVFPLRLMLRLGAEYRYYPAPLVSTRDRKPVYGEIGHTIMNVLADFKNYAYTLPTIKGLVIHMSPGRTLILIPKNRHDAVSKALNNSNDPVLALGANFSMSVDSHLVAMQTDEGTYQTQAINIQHKERVVTGASFVVFNGALKSTANLTAKSSIVEDGIMVQVLPDHMMELRKNLQDMQDVEIGCGPVGTEKPPEVVSIQWVDEDKAFNIGIKSVLDGRAMDGIGSLRIHCGPDMRSETHLLRWTEVFLIKTPELRGGRDPDPTRVAEGAARAVGIALIPHLANLKKDNLSPLAVRITLDQDNVSYEAGSDGAPLPGSYMNNLDNELIPLIHSAAISSLVMELVFHILEQ